MNRILLTSVVRPFGGPGEGDSVGAELFHAQVTRAQGGFSLRQVIRVWGLDLIAENLQAPAVVLHYPSMEELERELATGGYTHVGINFVVATFHKVRAMVARIRAVAPKAKVVLGGYGTVLPDELLTPHADSVCREEGVGFMRKLLGEEVTAPVRHAYSPVPSTAVLGWQQPSVVGHVCAGLGCANGCDFCCTSHFFKRKHVRLAQSGQELYDSMMALRARAQSEGYQMASFALIDEDFFLYKPRALEFLEAVKKGGRPLSIFGFGSIKGLSQFTAAQVAEMGFDLIWTAFEGKQSGYGKLDGRPIRELYDDLKDHGVATLSSMIIGFPYQDEATVLAEFDELMSLEPALAQILIYFAFPGTPLFEEVVKAGRFLPQYEKSPDLRRWDGFALHQKHPHFTPQALEALQRRLYRRDFERLGPSVHRLGAVWLRGAEKLEGSSSPLLRARGERLKRQLRELLPIFGANWLLPSAEAKRRAGRLEAGIERLTGARSLSDRLKAPFAGLLGAASETAARLGVLQQPALLRIEHRIGHGAGARADLHRLQGKGVPLLERLREDVHHLLLDRLRPPPVPPVLPTRGWEPIPADRGSLLPAST